MEDLRKMLDGIGYKNIQTYIQSGNVIFQSKESDREIIQQSIKNGIEEKFGFDVPVIVKDLDGLKKTIKQNPFIKDKSKDVSYLHITFLSEVPDGKNANKLKELDFKPVEFHISEDAVYLYCPESYSSSKLTNGFIESRLKVTATTRNLKTAFKLIEIGDKISGS